MDRELWTLVFSTLRRVERTLPRAGRRPLYPDRLIVAMYLWSVWHDRPLCWACDRSHYGSLFRPRKLPSVSQFTRRIKTERCRLILQHVHDQLAGRGLPVEACFIDGKPLVVGHASKDPDARNGKVGGGRGGWAKGYKLHAVVNEHRRIVAWSVASLNVAEQSVAAELLHHLPPLSPTAVVMADSNYDSAQLHKASDPLGVSLIHRLKGEDRVGEEGRHPVTLRQMGPTRRALVRAWDQSPGLLRFLLKSRDEIDRAFGVLVATAGGLANLPPWVRRLDRVHRWVGVKIILYNARLEVQNHRRPRTAA